MIIKSIAKALLLMSLSLCGSVYTYAQDYAADNNSKQHRNYCEKTFVFSGQVLDAEDGKSIPAAIIQVKSANILTVCDDQGRFSVNLPISNTHQAVFRSTGYRTQTIKANKQTSCNQVIIHLYPDVLGLEEVVVTGTRTEKTLSNSPVLTQVISAPKLRQNDFENIMDALEYTIPGLQFNSDPRGDNIRIQGLENKYILILVDGERLSSTPGGPIDFQRLSMSNVKQIEIVKGAASALYGSSSIGMTINIITNTPERKLEGWGKARYSKFNDLVLDASVGSAIHNFTTQTLFYRNSYDGYDLTPDTPQAYTKNPGSSMNVEQKLGWHNKNTKITAAGTLYMNENLKPKQSKEPTFYKSNNKTIRSSIEQNLSTCNVLKGFYYGDFYTRKTVYRKIPGEPKLGSFKNATSHIQTLRIMDVFSPLDNLQAIAGGEYNWNKDYNIMQYGEKHKDRKVNDINGFAQVDWQVIPFINVIGGFRYTHHSTFGNAYSPKLNVMFSLGNWRLRTGYSKGFKAPDATELYSDFMMGSVSHNIGNPHLKAEKSDYYYLSAEYRKHSFSTSIDIYQNHIDNKIESRYVLVKNENGIEMTEMRYNNVDKARIRGMEFSFDYYPIRQLILHGSYAYTDAIDMHTRLQLHGNTKHAFSCNVMYKDQVFNKDFSVSIAGHWSSKKINDREGVSKDQITGEMVQLITTNPQSAYSLWKLTVLFTPWKKGFMELNLSAGIQNIFDYTDPVKFTTYDSGRRLFGSAMFKF